MLTTGGTIDKLYFDALSQYQVGESVTARLLELGRVTHPFRLVERMRKDSLDLDDADRAAIVAKVADAGETRVVITHRHGHDDHHGQGAGRRLGQDDRSRRGAGAGPVRGQRRALQSRHGLRHGPGRGAGRLHHHENGSVFPALGVVKDRARGAFVASS